MVKVIARGHLLGNKIDCYVVDDNGTIRRLVGVRGILEGLGAHQNSSLQRFLSRLPSRFSDLEVPPVFEIQLADGGHAKCYTADHFADIMNAYVDAMMSGELHPSQVPLARAAHRTLQAYAKIGISAHIDNQTGYKLQYERGEVESVLERLLSDNPNEWERLWERETIASIVRLYGKPEYTGGPLPQWLSSPMDMVYRAYLGNTVVRELRRRSPDPEFGNLLHQYIKPEHKPALLAFVRQSGVLADQSASVKEWGRRVKAAGNRNRVIPLKPTPVNAIQSAFNFMRDLIKPRVGRP